MGRIENKRIDDLLTNKFIGLNKFVENILKLLCTKIVLIK